MDPNSGPYREILPRPIAKDEDAPPVCPCGVVECDYEWMHRFEEESDQ